MKIVVLLPLLMIARIYAVGCVFLNAILLVVVVVQDVLVHALAIVVAGVKIVVIIIVPTRAVAVMDAKILVLVDAPIGVNGDENMYKNDILISRIIYYL